MLGQNRSPVYALLSSLHISAAMHLFKTTLGWKMGRPTGLHDYSRFSGTFGSKKLPKSSECLHAWTPPSTDLSVPSACGTAK